MIDTRAFRIASVLLCALAGVVAAPHAALAQLTVNPYVDAHYEYDSNVFRVQNSQANLINLGDPTLADRDLRGLIGVDGKYQWGQQELTAQLEGRRVVYDHFTELNHNEYLANLVYDWKVTTLLDGTLQAKQEQIMAPFQLGNSDQLSLDVERKLDGTLNLNLNSDWRIETGLFAHYLKTPLQDFPDFVERDTTEQLALENHGISHLTYGIQFDHTNGRFENAPLADSYNQWDAQLTMKYSVSALSTFKGAVGYTRRDQENDSLSGITGQLSYTRQLTAKTSVSLNATRAVNSYVAAGGSELDTSGTVVVSWQATYRLGVQLTGGYTHSAFLGQFIPGSPGAVTAGRVDNQPLGSLNLTYQLFRHFKFTGYYNRSSRTSTFDPYNFTDNTVGLEVRWTLH